MDGPVKKKMDGPCFLFGRRDKERMNEWSFNTIIYNSVGPTLATLSSLPFHACTQFMSSLGQNRGKHCCSSRYQSTGFR
jgi:hypothetical protein